jgi:hypothetical protein
MIKTAGRILKSNDVKLEGQFHLEVTNAGSQMPKLQTAASSEPRVRVMENHPQYAVIEVTCGCGRKMSLKCEYATTSAQESDAPQT